MGSRQAYRVVDKATPCLQQGEEVEATAFVTVVTVGAINMRQEAVKVVAMAAASAVLSGGTMTYMQMRRPRKAYLAVTTRRLMFFNGEGFLGRPGKLLFTLPREAVQVRASGRFGLGLLRVELAIAGQDKGLQVNFAPGSREAGSQLVASLEAARRSRLRPDGLHRGPGQNVNGRPSPQPWGDPQPRPDWDDQWPQERHGQRPTGYR